MFSRAQSDRFCKTGCGGYYEKWCRTFLLSCLLCLSLCTLARAADGETLRVGLKYGSDAMSAANLQNYSAFGGYALGYLTRTAALKSWAHCRSRMKRSR